MNINEQAKSLIDQANEVRDLIDREDTMTIDQITDSTEIGPYEVAEHANFCEANNLDLEESLIWVLTARQMN